MGYRGHGECDDECRLNDQVTGRVVARRRVVKQMPGFCCPHPEREELPQGRHRGVLQCEQQCGRQSAAGQNSEESGFCLGSIDPGRATSQAVVSGENERQPEE